MLAGVGWGGVGWGGVGWGGWGGVGWGGVGWGGVGWGGGGMGVFTVYCATGDGRASLRRFGSTDAHARTY